MAILNSRVCVVEQVENGVFLWRRQTYFHVVIAGIERYHDVTSMPPVESLTQRRALVVAAAAAAAAAGADDLEYTIPPISLAENPTVYL